MKKKLLYGLLASMLVISLSACGKNKEEKADANVVESQDAEDTEKSSSEKVVVDSSKYVTLPDYKAIEVEVDALEVTDDDISDYITNNMLTYYPIEDRAIENGDVANIDYIGKKDGVAFDGGTAEGYNLTIGSGQFIPGFEEGLIGVNKGETVDLNLTFPEQYQSEELAGKEVVFTVTVNEIKGKTDYESLTVEQLVAMNIGYETKEALWEAGKTAYQEEAEKNHTLDVQSAAYDKLLDETTFAELPQELIDEKTQEYNDYMENMCKQYFGCDLETYITSSGQTMDQYNEQVNTMAVEGAKQELLLDSIAKSESITITDDELMQKAEEMAKQYNYESADAFLDVIGKEEFRHSLLQEQVISYLGDIVTVKEK